MVRGELKFDWVKEEIKEYWDLTKEHAFFEDDEEEEAWRRSLHEEFGTEKLKILDVGAGNGSLSLLFAEMGHDVVGIDISTEMLAVAKKKAKERGVDPDLRIGDAESLDFDDESFDSVVSRIVLGTLPNHETAIAEWMRVLKPGGRVYTFEIDSPGRRKAGWIKRNLGLLLITLSERKNAWKRPNYSKEVNEKLPLRFGKVSSTAIKKVELFRKGGFEDVSVFAMEEVSEISQKNQKDVSLGYKLAWGDPDYSAWYYIRGSKP
ncbi:MAG: Ubiquinone/menaquinone biosynthesis C-methyltransferase UbiE [Candidatus Argoarchaeum ethanivorans]|uniref:Ubiquinone/menaquinone biosynthesis C-methyltransferase UbiE n=1 Tax=Candidatus Argoarchaeum ethanivorans TaxID=2608793 RepID=A0A812A2Q1_9EURY|nr:MAG: Ubiquinone/menaquinone biosynthesis C-methyltransferase UbiE [Candidatus Argoarchaeum ethanivorans]